MQFHPEASSGPEDTEFLFDKFLNMAREHKKLKSGEVVEHLRHVVNYRDPNTGQRKQEFFELYKQAQKRRAELIEARY